MPNFETPVTSNSFLLKSMQIKLKNENSMKIDDHEKSYVNPSMDFFWTLLDFDLLLELMTCYALFLMSHTLSLFVR